MEIGSPSTSRPRGRPRQFDRDQAIATALRMFKERGYEGTSIADLTKAIGVSPTSLYGVFPSKEALFEEAVELYQRTEGAFAVATLDRADTAFDAIHDLLVEAATNYTRDDRAGGCFVALGMLSCGIEHQAIARRMAERRLAARDAIKARLDRGKKAGELRQETDTLLLAAFYAATVQGMSVQARDGCSEEELNAIARTALVPLDFCRTDH